MTAQFPLLPPEQARQLDATPPGQPEVYLLDTDCVVRLDGKGVNPPNPPEFSDPERQAVWSGLEGLAGEGRLKLIKQVRFELRKWHPEALRRLRQYRVNLILRTNREITLEYQALLTTYGELRPGINSPNKADPWLIIASRKYGYRIVSDELSISKIST